MDVQSTPTTKTSWSNPAAWTAGQVLIVVLVFAVLIGGSVLAYRSYMSKTWETERNTNELIENMRD